MTLINANNFASYEQAWDAYYNGVVPTYGATRMEWGFGKWLYIEHAATVDTDTLAFWRLLDHMGILTAEGRKRLKRAMKQATESAANTDARSATAQPTESEATDGK